MQRKFLTKPKIREEDEMLNKEIVDLVKKEMRETGLTWCTECKCTVVKGKSKIIFIIHGHNSEEMELCRVCPGCFNKISDSGKGMCALKVKKKKSGFYLKTKNGILIKISVRKNRLNDFPEQLLKKLARQWGFLPLPK